MSADIDAPGVHGTPPPHLASRAFSALVAGLNSIGTVWIFFLMALINVDVLLRYLFNAPINGVAEVVEISIVAIVFLQVSDGIRAGRLTRTDGLYNRMLAKWPALGHVLGLLFEIAGALFFAVLLLGAVPRLIEAYERDYFTGNQGLFVFPVWPMRLILVIGCVVAVLQFLTLAWGHVNTIRGRGIVPK